MRGTGAYLSFSRSVNHQRITEKEKVHAREGKRYEEPVREGRQEDRESLAYKRFLAVSVAQRSVQRFTQKLPQDMRDFF